MLVKQVTVVAGEDHDRVLGQAERVEERGNPADVLVDADNGSGIVPHVLIGRVAGRGRRVEGGIADGVGRIGQGRRREASASRGGGGADGAET